MAKSRNSRKGKKEWRKNISTTDHEAFVERSGKDERSGGPLDHVPSENLFFVDKNKASVKIRKVDKHRAKTLHSDSILKRESLVPPVKWKAPRPYKKLIKKPREGNPPSSTLSVPERRVVSESNEQGGKEKMSDLWGDEDLGGLKSEQGTQHQKTKRRRGAVNEVVPAVEVDLPGCSFNPAFEEHQDALAMAVAEEVVKETKKELLPQGPPLEVVLEDNGASGMSARDLEMYSGLEALLPEEARGELLEGEEEEEEEASPGAPAKPVRVNKKTRADLNRKIRRRNQEVAYANKLKRKQLMKDAERVKDLAVEIEEEEEERKRRRVRKEVARKENRRDAPPRLGKHRYEPEPVNVLLTEEVTGSLRQVKGSFTLARDRFKSLQKRGILEPRVPVKRKAAKRRKIVEMGTKGQKEREMHAEILQMRALRQGKKDVIPVN